MSAGLEGMGGEWAKLVANETTGCLDKALSQPLLGALFDAPATLNALTPKIRRESSFE